MQCINRDHVRLSGEHNSALNLVWGLSLISWKQVIYYCVSAFNSSVVAKMYKKLTVDISNFNQLVVNMLIISIL